MPAAPPSSRAALALLLLILPIAAYVPAMTGDFVWDDDYNALDKADLPGLDGLKRIWLDTHSTQQYYPLTHTSFWLDYRLWGDSSVGYHLENLLLHGLSALLLWLVLRRLGVPGGWLAAAIFALHPVHVESVAWITERKNTLSGLLYMASALCFLVHVLGADGAPRRSDERAPRWFAPLALLLFACALLAKTVTATLPVALVLLLLWKVGTPRRDQLLWLGAMLAAGAAMGFLTLQLETHSVGAQGAAEQRREVVEEGGMRSGPEGVRSR